MSVDEPGDDDVHHGSVTDLRTPTDRRPADGRSAGRGAGASRAGRPGRGGDGADGGSWLSRSVGWLGEAFADVRLALSLALGVVALGVLACVGLVVAGWASDADAATSWVQAVRVGVDLWLVVHLGSVGVLSQVATSVSPADPLTPVQGELSLAPLGLTLLAAGLSWRAGRVLAGRCRPVRALVLCLPLAAGTGAAAWLLAWAADTPVAVPSPTAGAVGAAALTLLASLVGVLHRSAGPLLDGLPRGVAGQLRRVVPAAGVALLVWAAAAAVLVLAGLLRDLPTVVALHGALAPGPAGGALLLLVQLAWLPTLVVWAGAVLAGPGAWLGEAHVGPAGSTVVDVPAVPLLAALPAPGAGPVWTFAAPLVLVLAGAMAAWHAHRQPSSRGATVVDRLVDAAAVAALAGLAAGGLGLLASGSLGPWRPLGPDPLLLAGAVAVEVLVGAVVGGAALHLLSGRPIARTVREAPGQLSRRLSPRRNG